MRKTIFLLNIDRFAPEVTRLTYPFINHYAKRIGAKIHTITERKFPEWPLTYEKLQIYELAKELGSTWNVYLDSDVLIHPECPDFTVYLPLSTVSFHGVDLSSTRFKVDNVFLRDGRYIAPGNWFTIASELCLDLWRPLEMTPAQALANIFPTPDERLHNITREHLIDDYALACNIARFGLHFKPFVQIYKDHGFEFEFLQHQYTMTVPEKIKYLLEVIETWKIGHCLEPQ